MASVTRDVKLIVLDYGSGNLGSVRAMLTRMGVPFAISNAEHDVELATHIILPGVGAFPSVMQKIRERLPLALLETMVVQGSVPFLGVCVGMHVLAEKGFEHRETAGLGWIPGEVRAIVRENLNVPHMGWNNLEQCDQEAGLLHGIGPSDHFYFVHGFSLSTEDDHVAAWTDYGGPIVAAVRRDNIMGVQFHPEKSQTAGARLMANFLGAE